jgi:hypothetical protein
MNQMYPDPDDMKAAQDSIDNRLRTFGDNLWVPTREEYLAQKEKEEAAAAAAAADPELSERTVVEDTEGDNAATATAATKKKNVRSSRAKSKSKPKTSKVKTSTVKSSASSGAEKSVRRRKRN